MISGKIFHSAKNTFNFLSTYKSVQVVFIQKEKVLRQRLENFSNVLSSLSTRLDVVRELLISSECQRFFVGDFARFLHICKVSDEVDDN